MSEPSLKINKTRKQVKLWVHPEGMVLGSLFVREQETQGGEHETPQDVLNHSNGFVVLMRQNPDELRFYNRNSIVRVHFNDTLSTNTAGQTVIPCRLTLMDGSMIDGKICEILPSNYSRLFDYLNQDDCRFLKLHLEDGEICLVNKTYINYVTTA